jgi:predicted ATPase
MTLAGPVDKGKARPALQPAVYALSDSCDGFYAVFRTRIRDPELVVVVIYQTLGVRRVRGQPWRDNAKDSVRACRMRLVLDNVEPVMPAARIVAPVPTSPQPASHLASIVTKMPVVKRR